MVKQSLSIVVPVYNEADNIEKTLNEVKNKVLPEDKEVLVVYDFGEDTTIPVVKRIEKNYPFKVMLVKNKFGRGALNAIKTGMREATGEAVLVIMGDLADDLSVANMMYQMIMDGKCDVVCGSRYMRGGRQIGGPVLKGTLSRMAGITLSLITGVPTTDATNSFKMYRKSVLDNIDIESNGGFEIGMEIVVKSYCMGYKVAEVPSIWKDRAAGESRFKLAKWLPKYLKWYFYAIKHSLRRTF